MTEWQRWKMFIKVGWIIHRKNLFAVLIAWLLTNWVNSHLLRAPTFVDDISYVVIAVLVIAVQHWMTVHSWSLKGLKHLLSHKHCNTHPNDTDSC